MSNATEKNRESWNKGSERYFHFNNSQDYIRTLIADPSRAFLGVTWRLLRERFPDFMGKRVCVPSSGDNHAVFAFAMLGARVTSCDISENQLANAEKISEKYDWGKSIEYIRADTMRLDGVDDDAYDLVYTSNGVHVWIEDLPAMYNNIYRVLKRGGSFIMYEIHPFLRPFNDDLSVRKPYDMVGPFEDNEEVTFAWRVMDILNALMDAGLRLTHMEEAFAEKNYDWPFWMSYEEIASGKTATREEVDRMHDWRVNPMAALPNWISVAAIKQ